MTLYDLELEPRCRMPKNGSQCYELLMAMKLGKRLTIWNAMQEHGCGALHQRIKELKDMGWPILRREVRSDGGAKVAEFWMEG